jgi:hypothetical protein
MPKQENNAGSGSAGPHKQGEKGGKGGTNNGEVSGGGKKTSSVSAGDGQTPKVGMSKINESGKGSGSR